MRVEMVLERCAMMSSRQLRVASRTAATQPCNDDDDGDDDDKDASRNNERLHHVGFSRA